LRISGFVKSEVDYLLTESNFTDDERELFLLRTKDVALEECAERMNISISTVNRLSKRIKAKINRLC
jgi:DNA-binding CsgD family transcriptional regulator